MPYARKGFYGICPKDPNQLTPKNRESSADEPADLALHCSCMISTAKLSFLWGAWEWKTFPKWTEKTLQRHPKVSLNHIAQYSWALLKIAPHDIASLLRVCVPLNNKENLQPRRNKRSTKPELQYHPLQQSSSDPSCTTQCRLFRTEICTH